MLHPDSHTIRILPVIPGTSAQDHPEKQQQEEAFQFHSCLSFSGQSEQHIGKYKYNDFIVRTNIKAHKKQPDDHHRPSGFH
jgi:hypothetical protein